MSLAHCILGLLERGGARHGYELRRELGDEFGPAWQIDYGQLYRLLAQMKQRRWVSVRLAPSPAGPPRKVYSVTVRGRKEMREWLGEAGTKRAPRRDEFIAKLRLALGTRAGAAPGLLRARKSELESERDINREHSRLAEADRDAGKWIVAEADRHRLAASLSWIESCEAVLPAPASEVRRAPEGQIVAVGSDDPLLDLLAQYMSEQHPGAHVETHPVGSLGGLLALQQGRADVAGVHLLDVDSGEYNIPFVRHILPEDSVLLVNLAFREQGLMVAPGNPHRIRGVKDLCRRGVRFLNRQKGSGTRLLLYHRLRQAGIGRESIRGYDRVATTHGAVAAAIAQGSADVGPGVRAAARTWGLDFIPLGFERFDLAILRGGLASDRLQWLLDCLHRKDFRAAASLYAGHDIARMGEVVAETR